MYSLFFKLCGWGKPPAIRPQTYLCGVALNIKTWQAPEILVRRTSRNADFMFMFLSLKITVLV